VRLVPARLPPHRAHDRRGPPCVAVLGCMRPLLDIEARSRCRKASLVPLTVLCSALTEYGRCDATTAILTAVNKMPKKWRMEVRCC
jgi:hypothetical protein